MDIFLVRKLGVPGYEELAMGAITTGEIRVLNDDVVRSFRITEDTLKIVAKREMQELERRQRQYRGDRPEPDIRDKIVILVDDGLATGASMKAAVIAVRSRDPKRIIVAVPTGAAEVCAELGELADEVHCAIMPEPFFSVGTWYRNFLQTSDEEVIDLLQRSAVEPVGKGHEKIKGIIIMARRMVEQLEEMPVKIATEDVMIEGNLTCPEGATGIVLFAHGSGSSRFSPRNRFVAGYFNQEGFATLLIDLLTREEESLDLQTAELRFNIPLLAQRVVIATDWLEGNADTMNLKLGYFGASTGAAAALMAASTRPDRVHAIVSRGGRPDLAIPEVDRVTAPTLFIVGEYDHTVIEMNRHACDRMHVPKQLTIVPGATHLFEEPGALEEVARLSGAWFEQYLK
jgi:putative phosphoribosyl transferase